MTVHRTPSPVERLAPRTPRRRPTLRTMGLGAIGDIGSNAFNQITTSTVTWSTQSDWDNAASTDKAIAQSGTVELGIATDSFERSGISGGDPPPSPWTNPSGSISVDTSPVYDGSYAMNTTDDINKGQAWLRSEAFPAYQYDYPIGYWSYETSAGTRYDMSIITSSGEKLLGLGWNNSNGVVAYGDTCQTSSVGQYDWKYAEARNFDWANNTFDAYFEEDGGISETFTGLSFNSVSTYDIAAIEIRWPSESCYGGNSGTNNTYDVVMGVVDSGSLTTATKSFVSSVTPDLQNLSYTLNGQEITLDVIGSPGTASEEIVTQTLDGSDSYALSWPNSHTDFRVRPNLDSTDFTTSPTVSQIELVG